MLQLLPQLWLLSHAGLLAALAVKLLPSTASLTLRLQLKPAVQLAASHHAVDRLND